MRPETPKLVIFDCDGTLVDTESTVKTVLADALSSLGRPTTCAELLHRFRGGRMADFIEYAEEELDHPLPEGFEKLLRSRIEVQLRTNISSVEGAETLLSALDVPVCVASNGPRSYIQTCLKNCNLSHYVGDHIFSAYDIGAWKPDPSIFLTAASHMGVAPHECIVVEDSNAGITAAHNAEMVAYALDPAGDCQFQEPVTRLSSLPELLDYL